MAVSTLSKIENNQTSPNYDVLARLCEGLELNLAEFFQGGTFSTFAHGSRTVNRLGDGIRYETPIGECVVLSSELSKKALDPRLIRVAQDNDEPVAVGSRTGEVFLYVLSGSVTFHMEPYSAIVLKAGESVHFDAQVRHGLEAAEDSDALVLVVCQAGSSLVEERVKEKTPVDQNHTFLFSSPRSSLLPFKTGLGSNRFRIYMRAHSHR